MDAPSDTSCFTVNLFCILIQRKSKGVYMSKQPRLGSGKRFQKLANKFAHEGIEDPKALASVVGRKKYGSKKMASMAKRGRERRENE